MKEFIIEENDANQRLDRFVKKLFPNALKSLIYKFNRKNKIKVNGKKEDNEYKLKVWDSVKIYLKDEEFQALQQKVEPKITQKWEKLSQKNIVYEDRDLLVINKDPGINVHPWDHKTTESNLISQVQDYLWEKLNSLTFKPSLVHRIDRNTSGIILIGKTKNTLTKLTQDLREHKNITKIYYALVLWKLPYHRGKIESKIKRIENAQKENKVQIAPDWQQALTYYQVIKEHTLKTPSGEIILSEVEVEIKTGRMHQIRVHLSSIWNPILGDDTYGERQINAFLKKNYWLKRQALHAWKMEFMHPEKKKMMNLEARIKPDLQEFIKKIS